MNQTAFKFQESAMDRWGQLYEIATGDSGGDAVVHLTEDPDLVVLMYPDGSQGSWRWSDRDWQAVEALGTAPGDVAARDSL